MAIDHTAMSRDEALLQYTARERTMIGWLERIATGTTGQGSALDLDCAREDACSALREIGWPVVADIKNVNRNRSKI
jgi:hypothetical protein